MAVQGTSNRFITPDEIARESLFLLKNNLVAARNVYRGHTSVFGRIGDTITIKKPARFKTTAGRVASTAAPMVDQTIALTVDKQEHVRLDYTQIDRTLSLPDFSSRYLASAISALAHSIDKSILDEAIFGGFHSSGSPGTAIVVNDFIDACAEMEEVGVPQDGMVSAMLAPKDAAAIQKDIKATASAEYAARDTIQGKFLGDLAGAPAYRTAQMPTHTVGALGGTPLVNGASQSGSTLVIDGASLSVSGWAKKGDVFTIAGVYSVNPQTYQSTGRLHQFVVTADADSDGAGNVTLSISPSINDGTLTTTDGSGNTLSLAAYQNVTALPADNAAITFMGSPGVTYRQALLCHRDAISLAMVDIVLPTTATEKARVRDPDSGVSLTLTGFWDGTNFTEAHRIDALWGVKAVYPDLIHRLWSATS